MDSRRINGDEDLGVNSTAFRRTIKLAWLYREPLAAQNDFFLPGLSQETQIRIRLFSQVYGRVYSISNLFNFQVRGSAGGVRLGDVTNCESHNAARMF